MFNDCLMHSDLNIIFPLKSAFSGRLNQLNLMARNQNHVGKTKRKQSRVLFLLDSKSKE